jgi:paraquat-inducible protein A
VATLARDADTGLETARLLACPECDLLQHAPAAGATGEVACPRCGATLYRRYRGALDATLALMIAAAVLFAVANVYPVMSLELQGRENSGTLLGMAQALHEEGVTSGAILVALTVVVMPGLEILAMLYLLVPLRLGRVPEGLAIVSRALFAVRPWVMAEVFILAALVSIGRLGNIADLELGAGFWAMGAVMFLFAVTDTIFDEHTLWERAAAIRGPGRR